jgi:hypothetical protein
MTTYSPDPVVQAEARRLVAENLDRHLEYVAELLAEQGHYGPDGRPYTARTVANLLDEDLQRRRGDKFRERNRVAAEEWNRWVEEHGLPIVDPSSHEARKGAAEATEPAHGAPTAVVVVRTPFCVPADAFPLTPEECWYLMRGYLVLPAREVSLDDLERMPGTIETVEGYLRLRQ